MSNVISFINFKGGTGKTTSVINLGAFLAIQGYKTLLVDLDPQSNLSEGLGVYDAEHTIYAAFQNKRKPVVTTIGENLSLIPSNLDCVGFDFDLGRQDYKERILQNMLKDTLTQYDFVLLDLPPTLNSVVLNALVISDYVVVPLEAEFFAYRGLDRIIDIVKKVKENSSPNIQLLGVLVTHYLPNRNLSDSITQAVKDHFDNRVFETKIRKTIKLSEAQAEGKSIFEYDATCNGAIDYAELGKELLEKLNK